MLTVCVNWAPPGNVALPMHITKIVSSRSISALLKQSVSPSPLLYPLSVAAGEGAKTMNEVPKKPLHACVLLLIVVAVQAAGAPIWRGGQLRVMLRSHTPVVLTGWTITEVVAVAEPPALLAVKR